MDIIIELLKYIFLGIVQGITEVLPISSSAHVTVIQELLLTDTDNSDFFLVILNFGSMIAVVYFLRKSICCYIEDFFKYTIKKNREESVVKSVRYLRNLFFGLLPMILVGYYLGVLFTTIDNRNPILIIGVGALMTATILYLIRNETNQHVNQDLTVRDSLFIGVLQLISILPGLSRLAVVTAAGVNRKLSMDSALKFAFLMFIPISIGSILQQFIQYRDDLSGMMTNFDFTNYLHYIYYFVGFTVSIFATYFALKWVFVLFRRGKLEFFYIYNLVFGLIALLIGISS
ncbi:MAG: undecaprenyl-diphosphate phosphatase [Candidatus Izemoplasmatales bacterium]|nr:undecaprenyl-diphosphate phosphatase [Candidatus Izemoplasmatales bacterium]